MRDNVETQSSNTRWDLDLDRSPFGWVTVFSDLHCNLRCFRFMPLSFLLSLYRCQSYIISTWWQWFSCKCSQITFGKDELFYNKGLYMGWRSPIYPVVFFYLCHSGLSFSIYITDLPKWIVSVILFIWRITRPNREHFVTPIPTPIKQFWTESGLFSRYRLVNLGWILIA